ncbi:MAG TPA: hypothetical protein VND93_04770 [Myxococcales bacterium]|jgi:hypothetical protein|nr:hypothetical protein [Myxococcales bacterium]
MDEREQHRMTGRLTLVLRDERGFEVERREVKNLITDAGRNLVAMFFAGKIPVAPTLFIAVGGDETAAAAGDTALKAFIAEEQANNITVQGKVATVTATLKAAGSGDVQPLKEAGIRIKVSGSPNPILYNRVTFPVVNKSPNMEMTLSWEVTF